MADLIDEFHAFKSNSRAHAAFYLRYGYLHPELHHIIRQKVEPWIDRVKKASPEIREKLLAEIPPLPSEPELPRAWTLPADTDTYQMESAHVEPPSEPCGGHPPPAAVKDYFRRRRNSISEFSVEDILHNERLWVLDICGLPESCLDPAPIIMRERATRSTPASSARSTELDVDTSDLPQEKAA
jgi:hypothetical protein